jgi:hypothetical protein
MQLYRQVELQNLIKQHSLGVAPSSSIRALIEHGAPFHWIPSSYTSGFIKRKVRNFRRMAVHVSYVLALYLAKQEKIKFPCTHAVRWVKEENFRIDSYVVQSIMNYINERKVDCGMSLERATKDGILYSIQKSNLYKTLEGVDNISI